MRLSLHLCGSLRKEAQCCRFLLGLEVGCTEVATDICSSICNTPCGPLVAVASSPCIFLRTPKTCLFVYLFVCLSVRHTDGDNSFVHQLENRGGHYGRQGESNRLQGSLIRACNTCCLMFYGSVSEQAVPVSESDNLCFLVLPVSEIVPQSSH